MHIASMWPARAGHQVTKPSRNGHKLHMNVPTTAAIVSTTLMLSRSYLFKVVQIYCHTGGSAFMRASTLGSLVGTRCGAPAACGCCHWSATPGGTRGCCRCCRTYRTRFRSCWATATSSRRPAASNLGSQDWGSGLGLRLGLGRGCPCLYPDPDPDMSMLQHFRCQFLPSSLWTQVFICIVLRHER